MLTKGSEERRKGAGERQQSESERDRGNPCYSYVGLNNLRLKCRIELSIDYGGFPATCRRSFYKMQRGSSLHRKIGDGNMSGVDGVVRQMLMGLT